MAREPSGVIPPGILVETDDDLPPNIIVFMPAGSVYHVEKCDPFGVWDPDEEA